MLNGVRIFTKDEIMHHLLDRRDIRNGNEQDKLPK
jgi:hypothetical protein